MRGSDDNEVALTKYVVELIRPVERDAIRSFFRDRIDTEDAHAEAQAAPVRFRADAPQADDAEGAIPQCYRGFIGGIDFAWPAVAGQLVRFSAQGVPDSFLLL